MASTLDRAPKATTMDVEDLAGRAWSGAIRVPHFQRDFRWSWEDVRRLFDSIIKGYPIGSLLLWQRDAPAGRLHLGALQIDAPSMDKAYWVVDGQQRLTSIANALHSQGAKDARFNLSFDLRRAEFVRPPSTFDPRIIPLPVLFDLQRILKWFSDNPGISDYLEKATSITKTLRQYEVPAYLVDSDDTKVLQDIFDRMNNYGRRLSRAEIFTALNAAENTEATDKTLESIATRLDTDLSFGMVDNNTVLAAVLARRNPEVRRDIRKEFEAPDDEGLNAAYAAGEEAMVRAVEFLQRESGVPHYAFLAYRYLLVVLTRLFALHPTVDTRNLELLRRWYWRAAVAGPEVFKGGTPNAARILCGKIDGDLSESVQRLLAAVADERPRLPSLKRFASNTANSKIALCMLWSQRPRDPQTGDEYSPSTLAESLADSTTAQPAIQTLVRRDQVPEDLRAWAASRALMPGLSVDSSELTDVLLQPSLVLSRELHAKILGSHILTEAGLDLLSAGHVRAFLRSRQEELEHVLALYLARQCEWKREDTPPLEAFDLDDEVDEEADLG